MEYLIILIGAISEAVPRESIPKEILNLTF